MIEQALFNEYMTRVKASLPKDCLANKLIECKKKDDFDGVRELLKNTSKTHTARNQSIGSYGSSAVNSAVVGHLVASMSSGSSYGPPCLSRASSGGSVISGGSGINITVHPFSII